MTSGTAWDPGQYDRFAAERRQPFEEVLGLLRPVPAGGRLVDLGCGNGSLTVELRDAVGAAVALGIDSSAEMLASAPSVEGVSFRLDDLATWAGDGVAWDLVSAQAALHWVGDHEGVLRRWTAALAPGGQLAVQVPANRDHPSHVLIDEVAADLGISLPPDHLDGVLAPEAYATLLHDLGYATQHVRLQVFGHVLDSTSDVVEWVKGTALVRVRRSCSAEAYEAFLDAYRRRLVAELGGDRSPFLYPFKRIIFVASLPPG